MERELNETHREQECVRRNHAKIGGGVKRWSNILHRVSAHVIAFVVISLLPGNVLAEGRTNEARQTKTIFDLLDTNLDGKVTLSEFKNNQMLVFYIWDKNKDMVLTPDETSLPKDVFKRISGENSRIDTMEFMNVIDSAFERADTSHDGILDLAEFTKMRQLVRGK